MTPKEIKMFDHPKIQEGWKPKAGDRVDMRKIVWYNNFTGDNNEKH